MKKIAIIGANEFQNKLIIKAKELGYETHVFAWKEDAPGEKTADYFYPISIVDKEEILNICKRIKPCAITSIASDLAMITINFVASALNLPCNSKECLNFTTNKFSMRKRLSESKIYTPKFLKVTQANYLNKLKDIKNLFFKDNNLPVIVKPTDRSGSRGITKVYNIESIEDALMSAFDNSFEKATIIEEYIDGEEYSCECISHKSSHMCLAITKKMTTGEPHFIETGHIQPSGLDNILAKRVSDTIYSALDSLKIENGASHSEFKIDKYGNVKIIEIGARMGGDCIGSDLVQISTGYDFLRMVIDTAQGKEPLYIKTSEPKTAEVHFIFNNEDLKILNEIEKLTPEKIYYKSDIDNIGSRKVVDSSTRFGYYILAY